uniref:TyrosylDNA phosphodiesterase putative n=1 Tax=Albugo laibachii Nc14 TaxID=890382 RepID=F0W1W9_9STRA|nr:tyrosylDNA phosphodiesterase putative [Albugo laibachii Nc14]|eukprot:CCA15048.1 tyrosylDNA phosphodiesterase putative [Albugo laibachii Nc14]
MEPGTSRFFIATQKWLYRISHIYYSMLARDTKRRKCSCESPQIVANNASKTRPVEQEIAFYLTPIKGLSAAQNQYSIALTDLLDGEFTSCLLSNYMYDVPWLMQQYFVSIFLFWQSIKHQCQKYTNIKTIAPYLPIPFGTHHSKMMIIWYAEKVRVAIFTANFLPIDWNNKTQGIWFQDFGLKSETSASSRTNLWPERIDFEADLIDYLIHVDKIHLGELCLTLEKYDFSTANVALVASVPGTHKNRAIWIDMHKYGHLRMRRLLQTLEAWNNEYPLICQFSSLGSLTEPWLYHEFTESLQAHSTTKQRPALHLIWPSAEQVRNSIEGWNAGRAIPCPLKNMKPFLHKFLRTWNPPPKLHRSNAMPHIKSYAQFDPTALDGTLRWALLSSSNLSSAAWGSYQKQKNQFMIRSFEIGVLFHPKVYRNDKLCTDPLVVIGTPADEAASQNAIRFPAPYNFPLQAYDTKQDEPWIWNLAWDLPDSTGACYIP